MELAEYQDAVEATIRGKKTALDAKTRPLTGAIIGSAVGSVTQTLRKRLQSIAAFFEPCHSLDHWFVMNPGDRTIAGPEGYDIGLSLPVASDIWYLVIGPSILPFTGKDYQENAAKILGFLEKYLERLDNIKPLKSLQSYSDLSTYMDWSTFTKVWQSDRVPHVIREMRFEAWMFNRNTEFTSKGPKACAEEGKTDKPNTAMGALYCGLLSFPVGPLGVMEVLSIFSESMDDMLKKEIPFSADKAVIIENPDGWHCVTDQPLDGFMSPMTDMKGACIGVHLVNKGYLIENRDVEYPAEPFKGFDKILPFHSMRYYLRRDAKWPLPGEFIGLLAKSWPSHVWWFQETSPLLYSGNWFETNYYTSGVVTAILQPLAGSIGLAYKCVVRGVEVCIAASDFYTYAVGDRVAILRINDLGRFLDTTSGNFKWKEMADLTAWAKMAKDTPSNLAYTVNPNMMILPMSFYNP